MLAPPTLLSETRRLAALRSLRVLDTLPEERFDRITRLACRIFDMPIALVSLVDEQRQWLKSRQGTELSDVPREASFCGHAIVQTGPLVVPDARLDLRFADNPLVVEAPRVRFYAGHPLHVADGSCVGTLCVFDHRPRTFSESELASLADLASLVERELCILGHATTDELTGLANRRGFSLIAEHVLVSCGRYGRSATLIALDLDGLDGHDADDETLRSFGTALHQQFRASDVVARLGNDEFAVLCSGASIAQVTPSLGRFRQELAKSALAQQHPELSWNAGLAEFHPAANSDIYDLLRVADARKYSAKQQTRFSRDLADL